MASNLTVENDDRLAVGEPQLAAHVLRKIVNDIETVQNIVFLLKLRSHSVHYGVMLAVAVQPNTKGVEPTSATSDWVVARAVAGDGAAFRKIFDSHVDRVRRFIRDILHSSEAVDEATQETFVRAHARLSTLKEPSKLTSWLLGIARLVALERLRSMKKERLHDAFDEARDDSPPLIGDCPSPRAQLLTAEADQHLNRALGTLPALRRQALLLRIDHRLGYEEIASVMEWPVSKVKNEIHRGRLELRKLLVTYTKGELS